METLIHFNDVTKSYQSGENAILAVNKLNFKIAEGEFVVILGPSGAGKSTLLNLLGGMDAVTSGDIFVDGRNIARLAPQELSDYRATDVGFIFQFYNLIPNLTVSENIALIKELPRQNKSKVDLSLDVDQTLESVGLLSHKNKFPTQLSGGEQQRVSIARAICKNPKMLLCDEPTGALDSETGVLILSLLQDMAHKHHRTVIIVTHNAILAETADRVIRIKNGQIRSVETNAQPKCIKEVQW